MRRACARAPSLRAGEQRGARWGVRWVGGRSFGIARACAGRAQQQQSELRDDGRRIEREGHEGDGGHEEGEGRRGRLQAGRA